MIILIILSVFLVIAYMSYYIMFYIDEYWDEAETRQQLITIIFVPFYCWVKRFIEYYNDLPEDETWSV